MEHENVKKYKFHFLEEKTLTFIRLQRLTNNCENVSMIIFANFMVIVERVLTCYDFETRHIFTTTIRSFSAVNSIFHLTLVHPLRKSEWDERVANGNKNKDKVLIFHLAKILNSESEFFSF